MAHVWFEDAKIDQLAAILLIAMIATTFFTVVIPVSIPTVSGQVSHLSSCAAEDAAGLPYDIGPVGDGEVIWDPNENHTVSTYEVEPGMTLNIPPLNSMISVTGRSGINVYGTFITNSDGDWYTKTFFNSTSVYPPSLGIYFHAGSEACIVECRFSSFEWGVVFEPGSKLISPGIVESAFVDNVANGLQMWGVSGYTNIDKTYFDDKTPPRWTTPLIVTDGHLNITNSQFLSHGPKYPMLRIINANVSMDHVNFYGDNQLGNIIEIDGDSNGTVLNQCDFEDGVPGYYYIKSEGVSFLVDNCSFVTSGGALSVYACENSSTGVPSHLKVRNPTADGWPSFWDNSFDNSSMNVTGSSSITLQWYMNVLALDPGGHMVDNAPVWVKDRLGNPAQPSVKMTNATGWAEWITCTEAILYNNSATYFSPFNVSAENNTIKAYAISEPAMNMSKEVTVTIPFNPVPNVLPIVSYIQTPSGVQSGPIGIQFRLEDPNPGDDGNLSVSVEFWDPILSAWRPADAHPSSCPLSYLHNNTLYSFVWASNEFKNFQDKYSTDVKIRITPHDRVGTGSTIETGTFTVDNLLPKLVSGPVATPTNTTALIQWTVDKTANASVWYGFDGTLTSETQGSTGTTFQSVTLTGLSPGRKYNFIINSTAAGDNKFSSYPMNYTFETDVHVQLYTGWNLISLPPIFASTDPDTVLASIAGDYDAVQWYNVLDREDPWKQYAPGKPFGNDLTEISEQMGLWIHMKNDAVLIHNNSVPINPSIIPVNLVAGWNLVGYPSVTTCTIDDAMGPIDYDIVMTYDAAFGDWLSWNGTYGSLSSFEMGRGYWIHVQSHFEWNVSYY